MNVDQNKLDASLRQQLSSMTGDGSCSNCVTTFRESSTPGKIGLFGGHRESDETFLECAVRELHEELGYYIAPECFEFLACYEGPDLAVEGGTIRAEFFIVRDVPSDKPYDC